jgi:hypothetical protein
MDISRIWLNIVTSLREKNIKKFYHCSSKNENTVVGHLHQDKPSKLEHLKRKKKLLVFFTLETVEHLLLTFTLYLRPLVSSLQA